MSLQGTDVSHYQGDIDWRKVREVGCVFAFAKATEGTTYVGPRFQDNCRGMQEAGLRRGAYHFFWPTEDNEADRARRAAYLGAVSLPLMTQEQITRQIC